MAANIANNKFKLKIDPNLAVFEFWYKSLSSMVEPL